MARDAQYVPILPSFNGFFKSISKNAKQGGEQAGRDFAESMERQVKKAEGAVEKATVQVERARDRQANSADKAALMESKLNQLLESGETDAVKIQKATNDLAAARRAAEADTKAFNRAERNLSKANEDLTTKSREAEDAIEGVGDSVGGLEGKFGDSIGKLGGLAAGLAGVSGAAAGFDLGRQVSDEMGKATRALGLTGEAADSMNADIDSALRSGVTGSAADAAGAIEALNSQFGYLGFEGEQTAGQLSDNFLAFADTFGVDIAEAAQTAGQLIQNGLATDVENAADLMTAAMQRVPVQMRDELPEIINEYGTNFRALGYSGEEAFAMLVDQADKGKWALDKTGDSLKEFTIRGSDMSKTSVAAYEAIGLNAEEMSNMVASGGDSAREALERTADGLLAIEDPAERANTAISLFGTPLEDLSVDQIPEFLSSLSGASGSMDGAAGASEALADSIENSLGGRLDMVKGTVASLAGDGFMWLWDTLQNQVVPAVKDTSAWMRDNAGAIAAVAAPVGILAGAYGLLKAQQTLTMAGGFIGWLAKLNAVQKVQAAITKASTAAQAAFNLVMNANPIFLAVTAIAALVAGLAIFFTKTETGREMWANFTAALGAGWDWLVGKLSAGWAWIRDNVFTPLMNFATGTLVPMLQAAWAGIQTGWDMFVNALSWAWTNIFQPVFSGIWTLVQTTIGVIGTVILAPLLIAWNLLSAGISWAWENVFSPVFNAIGALGLWLYESVLLPAFNGIKAGWDILVAGITWAWENLLKPAWDAIATAANWLWLNILLPAFDGLRMAWENAINAIVFIWEGVLKPAWDALSAAAMWLWQEVLVPAFDGMRAGWDAALNAMVWVWQNVLQPAWAAIEAGLNWLWQNVFAPVLGFMGDLWSNFSNGLQAVASFITDTVFGGLRSGLDVLRDGFQWAVDAIGRIWDGIKEKTKTPVQFVVNTVYNNGIRKAWNAVAHLVGLDELEEFTFATGGILPGYTPGRDIYSFIEPRTGMSIGLSGGEPILRPEAGRVLGSDWVDGINAAARVGGTGGVKKFLGGFAGGGVIGSISNIVNEKFPMMTITSTLRNTPDYHGQGKAVDFSNGTDDTPEMQQAAAYFAENYGKALLELIHSPFGTNIKNGQSVGDGFAFYGAETMNAHRNHVHVAADGPLEGGGSGGLLGIAAKVGGFVSDSAKKLWDAAISPIKEMIPDLPGIIGGLPGAVLDKLATAAWDFVASKLPGRSSDGAYHGEVGGGVEQWRGMVVSVLKSKGFSEDLADTVLRRMNQESGGNPGALNDWDSNAAAGTPSKGLMQVIDPTFQSYKDPGYDDVWDPEANLRASLNYAVARYGSVPAAYNKAGGYAMGGILPSFSGLFDAGGWLPHGGQAFNLSGKPEPILTNAQWTIIANGFRKIGAMVPALAAYTEQAARTTEALRDHLTPALEELATVYNTGDTSRLSNLEAILGKDGARATAFSTAWLGNASEKELFDTFSKLPKIGDVMSTFSGIVTGYDNINKAYATHGEKLADVAKKEQTLKEAREELAKVMSEENGLTKEEQRKLGDAQKALDEAKANAAKADTDDKRASATKKVTDAEEKLKRVREDIADSSKDKEEKRAEAIKKAQDAVMSAELDLSDARSAASSAAMAAGQAQIAMAIEIASTVMDVMDKIINAFGSAAREVNGAVVSMIGSAKELADMVAKQREEVIGLALDYVSAQIAVNAAARETRFTQISGAVSVLQAQQTVADAQEKFRAQLAIDANTASAMYTDLSLELDRFRWATGKKVGTTIDEIAANMDQWSDKTKATWYDLQSAQDALRLAELNAKKDNLEASYKQIVAALDLADVTRDLQTASAKLANMTNEALGFTQVGATVGQRYAQLAEELADIEANKWEVGTWLNPANWFNGYYGKANSRQEQIKKEMAQLADRPDFQGTGISQGEMNSMVASAGFMGLFGGSDDVSRMLNNSNLGDYKRSLERIDFENSLVDLETQESELRATTERKLRELEHAAETEPLTNEIRSLELSRDANSTWASYWRAADDGVRETLEKTAAYQSDTADQLKKIAEKKTEVVINVPAGVDAVSIDYLKSLEDELRRQNSDLQLRVDRVENPPANGAAVSHNVRG